MAEQEGIVRSLDGKSLHLLPCEIKHTGAARVSAFFHPTAVQSPPQRVEEGGSSSSSAASSGGPEQLWSAAFRGRQVTGATVRLPPGATGLFLAAQTSAGKGKAEKKAKAEKGGAGGAAQVGEPLSAHASFSEFTLWNVDAETIGRDFIKKNLTDWPALAHAIHDHIEAGRLRAASLVARSVLPRRCAARAKWSSSRP
eukprot:g10260.t1